MEKISPPLSIFNHNNDPDGSGRHISPGTVNISNVIAVNFVCDDIDGSYDADLERSRQARQGHILYSFTPEEPPVYLIVSAR